MIGARILRRCTNGSISLIPALSVVLLLVTTAPECIDGQIELVIVAKALSCFAQSKVVQGLGADSMEIAFEAVRTAMANMDRLLDFDSMTDILAKALRQLPAIAQNNTQIDIIVKDAMCCVRVMVYTLEVCTPIG